MHKKLLIGLLLMTLLLSFTVCYANDESNTAKNMVNTTQNTVEGAASDAGKAIQDSTQKAGDAMRNGVEKAKNVASDAGRAIQNGAENVKDTMTGDNNTNVEQNTNYTATRTAGEGTFMGMTGNTWSWLILGIAAIAIIALVWYYSTQLNNTRRHDDND